MTKESVAKRSTWNSLRVCIQVLERCSRSLGRVLDATIVIRCALSTRCLRSYVSLSLASFGLQSVGGCAYHQLIRLSKLYLISETYGMSCALMSDLVAGFYRALRSKGLSGLWHLQTDPLLMKYCACPCFHSLLALPSVSLLTEVVEKPDLLSRSG